jgi:histidine ammonia-lyase
MRSATASGRAISGYNPNVSAIPTIVALGEQPLTLEQLVAVARHGARVTLGESARAAMLRSRAVVEAILEAGDDAPLVYGVNTGFGALAEVRISAHEIITLQRNLVRSHAAGVGASLSREVVRAMMLLRAAVLARGLSGARPVVCERLCALLERGVHPCVPSRGSVGASGDLAPLAHLALTLIGEGTAELDGEVMPSARALQQVGLEPLELLAKEGLTLLNGTQHMTAIGGLTLHDARDTCLLADIAGAMSLEAVQGSSVPFRAGVVGARPHPGQLDVGARLHALLDNSEIARAHKDCGRVQDAYSLRCMPQVHGASRDMLAFARQVIEREANSCTDNPLVFVDPAHTLGGEIISGGNFHGQPVALALDAATMAVAELASISERRIEQLVNPSLSYGLPAFLATRSGLDSGFMMAQVTAAALVSENKVLSHPACVDSIPTSANREDHVSMGALSALKLAQVHDHARTVLAIEFLCAAQALDLRAPLKPGEQLAAVQACIRQQVSFMTRDRPLADDIAAVRALIDSGVLIAAAGFTLAKETI